MNPNSPEVLDLSYVYELASNEPAYIYDILGIFLDTVPKGIYNLEQSINDNNDLFIVYKNAHFLKSSTTVIKIGDLHENICKIADLARNKVDDRGEMLELITYIKADLDKAVPILIEEKNKNEVLAKVK